MAGSPSDQVHRQVHRLFHHGAIGTMCDAQLLDRFVTRRDEAAEAAFEELVNRHGPMVLRVCRGVLHDLHDAEDAFQAVFLVLTTRAASIRRSGSVASWLFGVAQRVATRARRTAERRHKRDEAAAGRAPESGLTTSNDPDWVILHDEIEGLPDRLRAPIVLCYLEGHPYAAAADQLGVSEMAIRGRLARARDRLRVRLTRRGVMVPAGLLTAGAAAQAQAALPLPLTHSTIRIALGLVAGNTAALLARKVMHSMLLNQVKVAAVLLALGLAGSSWAWHAFAGGAGEQDRRNAAPTAASPSAPPPTARAKSADPPAPTTYRLTGTVRVEGTGEPVKGGTFTVLLGDMTGSSNPDRSRTITSAEDGTFLVDLPPGQARAWTFLAPTGYWAPGNKKSQETFVLSRTQPVHRKDHVVRRGSVWPIRLVASDERPVMGSVRASTPNELFQAEADATGRVDLTLPIEAGKVTAGAATGRTMSRSLASLPIPIPLEWAAGFQPETVKTIERIESGYRLKDDAGRSATIGDAAREVPDGTGRSIKIGDSGRVEPTLVDGKLEIRAIFSDAGRVPVGRLSGRIVDEAGRPIEGATVALAFHIQEGNRGGGVFPDDKEHEATTDRDGRFVLSAIPRQDVTGKPTSLSLVIRKENFANQETPRFSLLPGDGDTPQELAPITLEAGVSLVGTVVDPDGQPAAGVWVEPNGNFALRNQFTRTDAEGKFVVRNLPRGMIALSFEYGSLAAEGKYLADGGADSLKIQLRPRDALLAKPAAPPAAALPALGQPAPAIQVNGWTDGKARTLADYHGKVVFLDFWGIWCDPCVNQIPILERLKQKFEPRGVVFLSIHTPGEEIGRVQRFLDLKHATLVSALDEARPEGDGSHNGVTAQRYGVKGYPTLVMIDRQGNLAFHSGIGTREGVAAMKALGKEMGIEESTMTQADFYRIWEAFFGREIERMLDRR